jgi:hypothetical protein
MSNIICLLLHNRELYYLTDCHNNFAEVTLQSLGFRIYRLRLGTLSHPREVSLHLTHNHL